MFNQLRLKRQSKERSLMKDLIRDLLPAELNECGYFINLEPIHRNTLILAVISGGPINGSGSNYHYYNGFTIFRCIQLLSCSFVFLKQTVHRRH